MIASRCTSRAVPAAGYGGKVCLGRARRNSLGHLLEGNLGAVLGCLGSIGRAALEIHWGNLGPSRWLLGAFRSLVGGGRRGGEEGGGEQVGRRRKRRRRRRRRRRMLKPFWLKCKVQGSTSPSAPS